MIQAQLENLDLNLLKALYYLLDEQSVTRAARRMGLSQSAMSRSLGRLRLAFGDPLFTRTSRGLLPTPRAESLAEPLLGLFQQIESLVSPPEFVPSEAEGWFQLQAADFVTVGYLPPILARLRHSAPEINVRIRNIDEQVYKYLEEGSVDVAMGVFWDAPVTMMSRKLLRDHFTCVMRRDHPALEGEWDLDAYLRYPHVTVSLRGRGRTGIDHWMGKEGLGPRRIGLVLQTFFGIARALLQTHMFSTLPMRIAEYITEGGELVHRPLPFDFHPIEISSLWHERYQRDPRHRWLRQLLHQELDEPSAATPPESEER